jgi:hypothetical protein
MPKTYAFAADDSLEVTVTDAAGQVARWNMTAEQALKHDRDADFRTGATAPLRAKLDAL